MTKFDGVAKTSRVKTGGLMSGRELKKNMEIYKQTGVHPLLEAQKAAKADAAVALPVRDLSRPHVYMEFSVDGKPVGKLVFELFQDHAPQAVTLLRQRCGPGASDTFQGDEVHKFLGGFAFFGGLTRAKKTSVAVSKVKSLCSTVPGCLAIGLDGKTYAISMHRALKLDETHQVVGRMIEGCEGVLDSLRDVGGNINDAPQKKIVVTACGSCSHTGVVDSLTGPDKAADPETLKKLSEKMRGDVASAVAAGLKRKAEEGEGEGAGAGAGAGPGEKKKGAAAPPAKKSKGMFDAVLGDISSDEESEEDE